MAETDKDPITAVVHIPKAAGTTLRWIAKQQYRDDPSTIIAVPRLDGEDPGDFFASLSAEQKRKVLLINNATCVRAHEYFDRPVQYLTLLRNPLQRVLSWDAYKGRQMKWTAYRIARKVRDNAQTRALAGIGDSVWNRTEPVTAEALELAIANLRERFILIGPSERFDENPCQATARMASHPLQASQRQRPAR